MVSEVHRPTVIETVLELLRRRKWVFILSFIPVFLISASIIQSLPSLYRSSAKLLVGQEDIFTSFVTSGSDGEYIRRLGLIQQSLLSRKQLRNIIEKFNLYPGLRDIAPWEVVIGRMRRDIRIEQQATSPGSRQDATIQLTVSYQTWDPELAAVISNELVTLIRQENQSIKAQQVRRTTEFLSQQLNEVRNKLTMHEQRLGAFQEENLNALPQQQNVNMAILQRLSLELRMNNDKQLELRNLISGLDGNTGSIAANGNSPMERLSTLQYQLSVLGNRYTRNHPEIIRLQAEVESLELEMAEGNLRSAEFPDDRTDLEHGDSLLRNSRNRDVIQANLSRLEEQENDLGQQIRDVERRIEYAPRVEQDLTQMTNEYNQVREEFATLQRRFQDASMLESLENQENQQIRVLEAAVPSAFPVAPARLNLLIMAFMVSGLFAGGLVFISEQADSSFHSTHELRTFTSVPVIGNLRAVTNRKVTWNNVIWKSTLLIFVLLATLFLMILASNFAENALGIVWRMANGGG